MLIERRTNDRGGILDHHRLQAIWHDDNDPKYTQYEPKYYPDFVRLMEEYEVSVRLEGTDNSLISQILPYERPPITR